MKVLTIVGARPQFVKAAPVCKALRAAGHVEILVHTGQHYDHKMSDVFFEEMGIPTPDANLEAGGGSHGEMTGQMIIKIEKLLMSEKPDCVVIFGDTNSTLAGAIAARKLHIPIAHIEAGLRSYNRSMPEEHNRVIADHTSDFLFCPTETAVANLAKENIKQGVHLVGDTMLDAVLEFGKLALAKSKMLAEMDLKPKSYLLATLHRPYNADDPKVLASIFESLAALEETIVLPIHPRTRGKIEAENIRVASTIRMIDPVGYLDMLALQQGARMILTDSGGVQKEAFFFKVPCVTLRPETEWVETVQTGWNVVVGSDRAALLDAVRKRTWPAGDPPPVFGDGHAAEKIVRVLQAGA